MGDRSISTGLALPTLMILVNTGCGESPLSSPTELEPAPRTSISSAGVEVPFRLSGEAVLVGQDFAPGFPGGTSSFEGRCSVPSDFVIQFSATGEAAHVGRFTAFVEHCTQIDFQTGESTLSDGVEVITAANKDELWATYRSADVPEGEFDEMVRFAGGTGRFEDASGEGLAKAVCIRAIGACPVYELRGVLVYAASDRRR